MTTRPAPAEFGRWTLVSFFIAGILIAAAGCFGVMDVLQTDLPAIAQAAPVIRLSGGVVFVVLAFTCIPIGILMAVTGFLLLIDKPDWFIIFRDAIAERTLYVVLPLGLLAIVIQPVATRIIMPMHGYSICHGLKGGLSRYSSDWVRDPAWCVRNQSMEWVTETAAREAAARAASPSDRERPPSASPSP